MWLTVSVCVGDVLVRVDADCGLVRKRGACLVEDRRDASVVGQQGQSTTILFITLEVANSKAKSEGIQIYCYK